MKTRTATLGILAAALGGIAALVGVAASGKRRDKAVQSPAWWGEDAADTAPTTQTTDEQAGGPSGPTAHAGEAPRGDEGHAVPDLAPGADVGPDHRAPAAFRPDMDAPMTDAEREALRPATGPAPSLVGASTSQPSVANG